MSLRFSIALLLGMGFDLALFGAVYGCSNTTPKAAASDPSETPAAASAPPIVVPAASITAKPAAGTPPASADKGEACGDLCCRAFASPEAAFSEVLSERPLVLGIGEAHAQKGSEGIVSTTKRFTEALLP